MIRTMLAVSIFWCRAEPVVPNGDDYFKKTMKLEMSCEAALRDCQKIYNACEITGCGEVEEESNFDSRNCKMSTGDQDYD
jgi:hypothetical protein